MIPRRRPAAVRPGCGTAAGRSRPAGRRRRPAPGRPRRLRRSRAAGTPRPVRCATGSAGPRPGPLAAAGRGWDQCSRIPSWHRNRTPERSSFRRAKKRPGPGGPGLLSW
ncbi:hypothetical protein ACFFX0_01180 [Citricoccus parietis]|uniref:Uncharacterized protein n=1 Tax=Citricoccus parietis TaxID=592307 RepID=A0ABV5FT85_9MICC